MIYDDYVEYTRKYKKIYGDNTIVFIEIGSFFEIYGVYNDIEISGADMNEIGNLLNIQISRKNKSIIENSRDNPLMAGFPNHSLKKFIDILIKNNYTIVLVEQVTPPPNPKREVTNIISPSTYFDSLQTYDTNNLVVMYLEKIKNWKDNDYSYAFGITKIDLSTSRTNVYETTCDVFTINEEITRYCLNTCPKEIVVVSKEAVDFELPDNIYCHNFMNKIEECYFNINYQNNVITKLFGSSIGLLSPIEYVDLEHYHYARISFVFMLDFVSNHSEKLLANISKPILETSKDTLILSHNALQQLDIINKKNSLCDILNNCVTNIGKRYFKTNLTNPSSNEKYLNQCYENVTKYLRNDLYETIRPILKQTQDIERIIHKQKMYPYHIVSIHNTILHIEKLLHYTGNDNTYINDCKEFMENSLNMNIASKYSHMNVEENIFMVGFDKNLDDIQSKMQRQEKTTSNFK